MVKQNLLPKRPYILKAYFDWLVDNDLTPYLVVNADYPEVKVPMEYVKDGQIVLNLSLNATGNLQLTQDFIQFNARFRGIVQDIFIPMGAALAIYARENGDGVMFEPEAVYDIVAVAEEQPENFVTVVDEKTEKKSPHSANNGATSSHKKSSSHLRIVK